MTLQFRPHHFMCALTFQGKGYSPNFVKNFTEITETLKQNPATPIEVISGLDTICRPCPHHPNNRCEFHQTTDLLDQQHSAVLQLKTGDVLSWQEAKARIKTHMTLEKFHTACASCGWKKLGICEDTLRKLIHTKPCSCVPSALAGEGHTNKIVR